MISVKEAWGYFRGSLKLKKEDTILQDKFWKIIKSEKKSAILHGFIHPKSFVGFNWLKKQNEDFFN